jgi:Fe-S-cluster containining protein
MYEFYSKTIDKKTKRALRNLYEEIPETDGCMENIAKEGGCGAWCCEHQSPSLFYSEFMHAWLQVEQWPKEKLASLMLRCIETYIYNKPTKGCVFWDKETKLCQIHHHRPFNCRTYGQVPEEDFKPRFERLKILYADNPDAVVKDQCNLVKSSSPPTKNEMDAWFRELKFIEERDVGIHVSLLNDRDGGSYRQFHDHIILKNSNDVFLLKLSQLRRSGTDSQKAKFMEDFKRDLERDLGINEPKDTTKSEG